MPAAAAAGQQANWNTEPTKLQSAHHCALTGVQLDGELLAGGVQVVLAADRLGVHARLRGDRRTRRGGVGEEVRLHGRPRKLQKCIMCR